ncbi:hypothetical protein FQN60_010466 [Etheostoma spectabile]|uniref:Uncharacterized protein n=1 Tax=Etheostoma spectabile TaxID=54343 RepID=A0A5J5DBH7_9PERO|nr:hypothetical protein FQN60_010466 [Etheostoma spectabile]
MTPIGNIFSLLLLHTEAKGQVQLQNSLLAAGRDSITIEATEEIDDSYRRISGDRADAQICKDTRTMPQRSTATLSPEVFISGLQGSTEADIQSSRVVCTTLFPLRRGETGCGRPVRRTRPDVQRGKWGCGRMSSPVRKGLLIQPADIAPGHLRGGVDIQEARSPPSKGSDLTDTNCWESTSGLCGRSSGKEDFPSGVSVAFSGLLSDMSASTLKGRQDTCAARFSGRGASASSSVENSSLQSPGECILSFFFLFQGRDRFLIPIQKSHTLFVTECKHAASTRQIRSWRIVLAVSPRIRRTGMKSISVTSEELYFHLTKADGAPNSSPNMQDLTHHCESNHNGFASTDTQGKLLTIQAEVTESESPYGAERLQQTGEQPSSAHIDRPIDSLEDSLVGQPLPPQLTRLTVTSLCLMSWFSSSILDMVLRTASLAYPGQGTHSQEKKEL